MVHRQRRRDLLAHALLDAPPQFDGHQRIHAEVEEPGVLANLGRVDSGHIGDRVTQEVRQQLPALLHRGVGEPLDELCLPRRRGNRHRAGHLTLQLGEEGPSAGLLIQRQEFRPVDPGHDAPRHTLFGRRRQQIGQAGQRIGG